MGCFCKSAMGPLQIALPALDVAVFVSPPEAEIALALSTWLSVHGLPASPWIPDPAWLEVTLPRLAMRTETIVTLSAIANLRAQVLAQFGLDLLVPAQANMFARLAATLSARIAAMADARLSAGGLSVTGGQAWLQLAALNFAIDQAHLALQAGVFAADPEAYAVAPQWPSFLAELRALLPLICIGVQFGIDLRTNFSADLAAAVRAMLTVRLPALPTVNLDVMASLSRQLFAAASLSASLGIAPLQIGFPAVRAMVLARLPALQAALAASFGISLRVPDLLAALLAFIMNNLPRLPPCPTLSITPPIVQAALTMNAEAVAALSWRAPALPSLPLLQVGMPVASLSVQLNAALGIRAAIAPCSGGCDANAVLRAAFAA